MRRTRTLAAAAAVGLLLAACKGGSTTTSNDTGSTGKEPSSTEKASHKQGGTLTIANVQGQTWTCHFNPFNPAVNTTSLGFVYEPLVFVNLLQDQKETPMLASSYQWTPDKKSIVFTVRDGVTWNDGQPFSAADVEYTFNLMKKVPSTDLYALWTGAGLTSVTASGKQVTMRFNQPAGPYFFNFANQVGIVPKHIFSTGAGAAHPDTWEDPKPVGTGPFTVDPCSPNNIQYVANPNYWQPGKPYIQKVQYPAYLDNGPANLDLANGKAQWGSQFIPNIKALYLNKSKENHTWSPPVTNVALIGEGGQQPAANQTGIVVPTFQKYYDQAAVAAAGYDKPNPDKAKAVLAGLGYTPANPLELTIITITGYTDWDASLAVVKQQLKPVGIDLTVADLAQQTFDDRLYNGNFDLAYYGQAGGPTPYYELRQMLYSKNSAPIGKPASFNYERYLDKEVDALFDQYPSADEAGQVEIIKKVGAAVLRDIPIIPTTESVNWFQYNTADIAGWPTENDPYCQPAAFNVPDVEQLLLHVYSKSAQ